jgi:clan AA aspartic protease (TIGR02281 family)
LFFALTVRAKLLAREATYRRTCALPEREVDLRFAELADDLTAARRQKSKKWRQVSVTFAKRARISLRYDWRVNTMRKCCQACTRAQDMPMRLLKLLLLLCVCAAGHAAAGPYDDAYAAYNRGDFAKAMALWMPLAERGDTRAQWDIATMYENGQGVPVDLVRAYLWFSLAATAKEQRHLESHRDKFAGRMTSDQIAMARAMSLRCLQSRYATCNDSKDIAAAPPLPSRGGSITYVPMKKAGGTFAVPVLINNAITLDFTVDSGASDVSIPVDVVSTLIRMGTIKATDFIGEQTYVLADGSRVKSKTFRIRSLRVGDRVLENVTGSVAGENGSLLLGQSFLGRFKSWSIDNGRHALVLE